MQKGGRIKFDDNKWVVDAKYRHFASEKEAAALNLLGFKPSNDKNTTMSTGVYKNIYKKNEGFNSSIITAFKESSYLNKKKIVQLFLEAALLRYKASLKNRSGTDSDGTHDFYQNLLSSLGESLQQEIDNLPIRSQVGSPVRRQITSIRTPLITPIRKQTKKRRLSYEPERHVKKKHYSFISKLLPDDLSKLVKNLYPEFDESILDEDFQLQSINTDENQYNNRGNHDKFNEEDILNFFKDLSLGNNVGGRKKTRKRKKKREQRKRENKEKERTKKKREQRKRENKEKERTKERK